MTAANRCYEEKIAGEKEAGGCGVLGIRTFGLYSAFRAWSAIVFKSSLVSRFTVATMFLQDKFKFVK